MLFRDRYIRFHILRLFFENREAWEILNSNLMLTDPVDIDEYNALIYGTDADFFVPLWTSICVDPYASLLNSTTRDVISRYKKAGYKHIYMHGNPPDYIGQLCRFMEYLSVSMFKNPNIFQKEYDEFLHGFFSITVNSFCCSLSQKNPSSCLCWIIAQLQKALRDEPWDGPIPDTSNFDSIMWTVNEPLQMEKPRKVPTASFGDCGRKCKMISTVQEGCILSITPARDFGEKDFSGCPRGVLYRETFLSPRRLRTPMVRIGKRGEGKFRPITWNEASKIVAEAIAKSAQDYYPEQRYVMPGSGVCALMQGTGFLKDLLSLTGGYLGFYNYYSCACAETILPYMFGTDVCGSSEEELWKTKYLILWGNNPSNTLWGDNFIPNLKKAKKNGVKIVVIDPRQSETAVKFADQWIGILPSTDGALADAMAYEIWSRNLQDQEFMDRFCLGFDEEHMPTGVSGKECYRAYLFGELDGIIKNAGWAEKITGIHADTIIDLAISYATAKPAWILPGLGPQRTLSGEQNCRSIAMLSCLTGNVGIPGGGSGGYLNRHGHPAPSRKLIENPFPGTIPSFTWETSVTDYTSVNESSGLKGVNALRGGIKLLFAIASGMLMNQHSNICRTEEILKGNDIETLIISDLFMTPGARFADLLLPGTSFFETENVVPPWNASDYLLYNAEAIDPLFESRFEYQWICEAAHLLQLENELSHGRSKEDWLRILYESHRETEPSLPDFDTFRNDGGYIYPYSKYEVAFYDQIHMGVPFDTPSGKIEIFSKRLFERHDPFLPGIPRYIPCEEGVSDPARERFPLLLIGFHTLRGCHSTHDNNPLLDRYEKPSLWISVKDAEERGIKTGSTVEIYNNRGRVRITANVTDRIIPGAVAMSEGRWYTPDKNGIDTRGSINVLTMSHRSTPLAHANPQHTNLVQVRLISSV